MSQFFGCITFQAKANISAIASQMLNSMLFFKEDALGIFQTNNIFICNKFLFNTPESVNTKVICQNQRYVLAATCRLDNREDLAQRLNIENASQASDHEYILAAYTHYQEKCVEYLIGDFSFVIWDKQEQKLFLAKDHLGIKPLFYYQGSDFLLFSTSIHTIKSVEGANLALDKQYIARELKGYPPTFEDTFFEFIKRLKPAHYIQFAGQNKHIIEQKYWELTPKDISVFKTEQEVYEELRRLFYDAVVCRTRTIKNIGCQLSGGLDSSAIAVLASRNIDKNRLYTYSFVLSDKTRPYSEKGIDEQQNQDIIIRFAELNRANHYKIEEFHYKDVFEELEASNLIMGGYAVSDAIWQDTMLKKAGENNVGYMLSGFPGDECVSNHGGLYYYEYLGNRNWSEIFRLIKTRKLTGLKQILSYLISSYLNVPKWSFRNPQEQRNLLHPQSVYNKSLKRHTQSFKFYPTFKEYLKNQIYRPFTNLRTESEGLYALQYGIETVYPLADIRLLEMVISLPIHFFIPKPQNRMLFRKICKDILPNIVRWQTKHNGALTLAFAEYWASTNLADLKVYQLKNSLNLIDTSKEFSSKKILSLLRSQKKYQIDYLIEKNKRF